MRRVLGWGLQAALIACVLGSASCENDEEQNDAGSGSFCESANEEVDELLQAAQSCEQDGDCSIVGLNAPCFILCGAAVNSATDLPALQAEVMSVSDDYRAQCEGRDGYGCAVADCADPDTLHAECTDGQCTISR